VKEFAMKRICGSDFGRDFRPVAAKAAPTLVVASALLVIASAVAQPESRLKPLPQESSGLTSAEILNPTPGSWPTYSGDYSGRRHSPLDEINQGNVKNLTLAWAARLTAGPADRGPHPLQTGGPGDGELFAQLPANIRGSILVVDGILYVSSVDNAWAMDARDGRVLWHYWWKTVGGTHIGNRGMGMWGNHVYFETPDNFLVSLDARTGAERWNVEIASMAEQYFSTPAPIIVGNHVIVGTGNDLDAPGFLQSFDAETGELQWKFYTVPMNPGDPGLETWKDLDAARNGGGHPWLPGAYDPETRLYIFGTGNPTPAYMSAPRGEGLDNLYTCSVVAVHVDTGKMAWYFQTSPHEMHDWDSAQTPVLVDGTINGKPRKLVVTASRNGYFFTLDRQTGERLVTSQFSSTVNWAKGLNAKGQPVRDPAKDHHVGGALVSSANGGATNWPPAAFSPDTGLLYVPTAENYAMYYLTELDPRGAMGLGGKEEVGVGGGGTYISAIDYRTGKTVWKHKFRTAVGDGRGGPGLLVTAGRLLFGGDVSGNFVAFDPATANPLWHARLAANVSNAPQTYLVGGKQHVLVAAGDTLYAFTLY
jgi:alcohol dehydrogenase (cytochrome c)